MYFEYLLILFVSIVIFLFIRRKFKKYKSIYSSNGFDGIFYYFINKNFKKTGFSNFIDKKKNFLGSKIGKFSKQKILYGPYSGTKIINSFGWSNVDFSSKYLGSYESHIQEKIIFLSKKFKLKYFIDLGAAEGFHIISLMKKKYFTKGIAFEINKKSRTLLKKNAQINGVSKKIDIFSNADFNSLKVNLKNINLNKTLFLIDIEGNEFYLFNNQFCDYFSKCFFIIEDHNFNIINKKTINNFYKNIKKKFKIELIRDISKKPFDYKILDNFTDDEKYLMMSEGRPKTMNWILLSPKK